MALLLLPLLCAPSALDAHADSILVLNQQSYPEVGGPWTVRFVAWGAHDLAVSGAEGTTVGAGGDVSFVGLRDGAGRHVEPAHDGGRLVFAGYEGGGTSELTVRVNTPGPHALLLGFGGDEALARNNAYPRQNRGSGRGRHGGLGRGDMGAGSGSPHTASYFHRHDKAGYQDRLFDSERTAARNNRQFRRIACGRRGSGRGRNA